MSMTPSPDEMPTVPEAEASGNVAAIYDDMRRTLGIPVVNLVWRHFAALPDGLQWAWETARPLYASGAVAAQAQAFRADFAGPALPAIPSDVLAAVGVTAEDRQSIARIFDCYNFGNTQNMLGLRALYAALDGAAAAEADPPLGRATRSDTVVGPMPPILAMHDLDPSTAMLVRRLNRIGARDDGRLMVSLYRHLAYWPGFLSLCWGLLAPMDVDGRIAAAVDAAEAEAGRQAAAIAGGLGSPTVEPAQAVLDDIRTAIDVFTRHAIAKIVPIGLMLRRALPDD